jgi:hypothetical protein
VAFVKGRANPKKAAKRTEESRSGLSDHFSLGV